MKEKNLRWRICSLALATSIALNTLTVRAEVKDKPVAKLEVMSQPQRTVYDVGEDVDLYGMKVKVTFTDGEIYVANSNDLTYQGYLQIIVDRFTLIGEILLPECKRIRVTKTAAQCKDYHRYDHFLFACADIDKIHDCQNQ